MYKQLRMLIWAIFFIPLIATASPGQMSSTTQKQPEKTVTLMLEWFVNPDHGPIIIAQQKGYFKEEGLNVVIKEPADPRLPTKMLAANQVDIAVNYQPSMIHGVSQNLPIAWVGTLVAGPLDGLLVLDKGPIKTLADMKGKTIGLNIGGNEKAFLNRLFKPYGFGADDVKLVNVGWNLSSSLMSGQVDAVMGSYRNFELNQLALEGYKGRMFYYEENGIPPYDELIFIANKNHYDADKLRRFMTAIERGTQFITNHPQQAWELFRDYNPKQLNNPLNKKAWFDTIVHFAQRPTAMDKARYDRFSQFLKQHGSLTKELKTSQYMIDLYHH
ncbi:putative thiamine biosynthesis protein [invertebrate metagenome]|uniref:Putative thiamine biosynthesis protein n=1 Tax=invertebrate metagenome TaxID=1711999 RepID=A0A2H9T7H7_9ZZZZ